MSRFLGKMGFHVVAAANGDEGVRLARQVRPLVITLDVVMPECDGWTVLKKLKSDSALAEIPVIMVTIVDNEAMALDLGASNYLIKPVDRDRLAVLIEKHRAGRPATITGATASPFKSNPSQRRKEERRASGKVDHAEDLVSRR
jgi:DNA-binding response OmpR family regulator